MVDLKERLLPPNPALAFNLREASGRPTASRRHPFQGVDVLEVKKRGQGIKSWIRVDTSWNFQVMEVDKFTVVYCDVTHLSQTEKLLAYLVEVEINKRQKEVTYKGRKFNAICHFFGYQARGPLPSKFDSDYAYVSDTSLKQMNIVMEPCNNVCFCACLAAVGILGILEKIGRDTVKAGEKQMLVVALGGGLFEQYKKTNLMMVTMVVVN